MRHFFVFLFLCLYIPAFSQEHDRLISYLNTYAYRIIIDGDGALLTNAGKLPAKDPYGLDNVDRSLDALEKQFHFDNIIQLSCRYILSDGRYTAKLYPWMIDPSSVTYQRVTISNDLYYYQVAFEGINALAIESARHSLCKIILKTQSSSTAENVASLIKSYAVNSKRSYDDLGNKRVADIIQKKESDPAVLASIAKELVFFDNEWVALQKESEEKQLTNESTYKDWAPVAADYLQVYSTLEKITCINNGKKIEYSLTIRYATSTDAGFTGRAEDGTECQISWLNRPDLLKQNFPAKKDVGKDHAFLTFDYGYAKSRVSFLVKLKSPAKPKPPKDTPGTIIR